MAHLQFHFAISFIRCGNVEVAVDIAVKCVRSRKEREQSGGHGLSCTRSGGVIKSTNLVEFNLQTKMKAKMSWKMTIFEEV